MVKRLVRGLWGMCHCAVAAAVAVAANSLVSGFAVLGTVFRRSSGEACSFGRLLAG